LLVSGFRPAVGSWWEAVRPGSRQRGGTQRAACPGRGERL